MEKFEKINLKTKNKTINLSYEQNLALALLAYAEIDKNFASYLKNSINVFENKLPLPADVGRLQLQTSDVCRLLLPGDFVSAQKRLNWMIRENKKTALAILSASSHSHTNEIIRPLIIGIVGMAIIGPTLGIVSKKKVMSVVVDKKISKKKLASIVMQATHNLVSDSLLASGGEARKLESDMADWLFGDKEIVVYESSREDLRKVKKELETSGVLFSVREKEKAIQVIAMSPAVNTSYLDKKWDKIEL